MILPCNECGKTFEVSDKDRKKYNIYHKYMGNSCDTKMVMICPECMVNYIKKEIEIAKTPYKGK